MVKIFIHSVAAGTCLVDFVHFDRKGRVETFTELLTTKAAYALPFVKAVY